MPYDPNNQFTDFKEMLWGLPKNSNIISTDPRSKGCNRFNNINIKSFTTHNVARDIIAIIEKEKLTDYIIVGHSYGSVVATVLSHMISQSILPQPTAVVISGVLGKSFKKGHRFDGYQVAWERLRQSLPEEVISLFPENIIKINETFKFPFGIGFDKWQTFIGDGLAEGAAIIAGKMIFPLKESLLILASNDFIKLEKLKAEVLLAQDEDTKEDHFFLEIYCNEIDDTSSECLKSGYKLSRPFDSSEYLINSPIIYFQGRYDPATPYSGAKYHFDNQKSDRKVMILSLIGGHSNGFMINDCKELFWINIFNDNYSNLQEALDECQEKLILLSQF